MCKQPLIRISDVPVDSLRKRFSQAYKRYDRFRSRGTDDLVDALIQIAKPMFEETWRTLEDYCARVQARGNSNRRGFRKFLTVKEEQEMQSKLDSLLEEAITKVREFLLNKSNIEISGSNVEEMLTAYFENEGKSNPAKKARTILTEVQRKLTEQRIASLDLEQERHARFKEFFGRARYRS
ncbi:MAG: hypothetical protein D6732_27730 [Methanobacteriota archaeon]|nr:MAG: hypothetical protein D6732_27730 [Euryarchaeota archaeon]